MTFLKNQRLLPFFLHTLIETPAALSFILKPSAQLPGASPEAKLILRSYGGLLLSTAILSAWFALLHPRHDEASCAFGLCMALYHLFPVYRAYARMYHHPHHAVDPKRHVQKQVLGGPRLHFWVHIVCFVSLVTAATTAAGV